MLLLVIQKKKRMLLLVIRLAPTEKDNLHPEGVVDASDRKSVPQSS